NVAPGIGLKQGAAALLAIAELFRPHREYPDRTGLQFRGPGAPGAVTLHPFHLAMHARGQPRVEPRFRHIQRTAAEACLLETELARPAANLLGKQAGVECWLCLSALRHGFHL